MPLLSEVGYHQCYPHFTYCCSEKIQWASVKPLFLLPTLCFPSFYFPCIITLNRLYRSPLILCPKYCTSLILIFLIILQSFNINLNTSSFILLWVQEILCILQMHQTSKDCYLFSVPYSVAISPINTAMSKIQLQFQIHNWSLWQKTVWIFAALKDSNT